MINKTVEKNLNVDNEELNNICDECKEEDESVTQNLILTGFKLCKSCRVSKTIFPL
jgi:hypothetical protein